MVDYFKNFFQSKQAGGFLLLICTIIALVIANSEFKVYYQQIWNIKLGVIGNGIVFQKTLLHWIDDGFMAVFFLLIGLEIKRELISGELSSYQKALLPGVAAFGGMAVPALIFILFNLGKASISGWGIPMATDIAFSIAVLSLVKGVPKSLRIFLVALAVVDDIGAIIVIAIFYSSSVNILYLSGSLIIISVLFILNIRNVLKLSYYIILGIILWYLVLNSGIHSTIAGVILAFTIPYNKEVNDSPLHKFESVLNKPVNFIILPLFALANTGIVLETNFLAGLQSNNSLGILMGLILGKPIGIVSAVFLSVKFGFAKIPEFTGLKEFIGIGFLCGIGYTMSIFISGLAYNNQVLIESSKISVLVSSLISALIGLFFLKKIYSKTKINKVIDV
jgi:Na+:H+ antiporter, NhaA family